MIADKDDSMTADKDDLQSIDGWLNGCMDPLNPLDSTHKLNNQKKKPNNDRNKRIDFRSYIHIQWAPFANTKCTEVWSSDNIIHMYKYVHMYIYVVQICSCNNVGIHEIRSIASMHFIYVKITINNELICKTKRIADTVLLSICYYK